MMPTLVQTVTVGLTVDCTVVIKRLMYAAVIVLERLRSGRGIPHVCARTTFLPTMLFDVVYPLLLKASVLFCRWPYCDGFVEPGETAPQAVSW